MTVAEKIALASLFVAFVSIILTIVTIYTTRKHNKLSVKPILKIVPFNFENHVAVYLVNAGAGPLLRQKLTISNGKTTSQYLLDFMPSNKNIKWSNYSMFESYVISPNEKEPLIELKGDTDDSNFVNVRNEMRSRLSGLDVQCEYFDIYGKQYVHKEKIKTLT